MASQLDVPWHCIHVETPAMQRLPEADRQRALRVLELAQAAGATIAVLSAGHLAAAIVKYAREHNLSRVVLGRQTRRRWWPGSEPLVEEVGRLGADLDVIQIAMPPRDRAPRLAAIPLTAGASGPGGSEGPAWVAYAKSAGVCAAAAAVAAPLNTVFELSNIVMLFLLAVVIVAVRYGRGPAVMAAFLAVGAFDFLYVPPRFSFSVTDVQYVMTFAVMLVVGLVIGQMTAVLKWQASVATSREERVTALYQMSRDLSGALMVDQVAEIAARFLESEFEARSALLVADLQDRIQPAVSLTGAPGQIDLGIAQWAFDHVEAAGQGTNTLPASTILYVPLKAPMRMRGVLAIEPRNPGRLAGPEQRRLLDTCASLLALSLERLHYIEVAQSTTVQMESERLRNSLLAAISHDLRTPLAALVGMAESMSMADGRDEARRAELARNIREAASRMNSQVNNLLDMARLQSGQVQLSRQWLPLEEAIGSAVRALDGVLDRARLKVDLPADLPMLHVDPSLFERVLCNLLENAVKYTPPGSPVRIGATAAGDVVRIVVDDAGPGLPRHKEEAIFDMFERGRKESALPGVGLGLAICRAIVGAHGGTITGETRAEGGARFTIELPVGEAPAVPELESALESLPEPASGATP
jgi:two-component system sensor histidine kinase KdpD